MNGQWPKLFVVTAVFVLLAGSCAAPPPPEPTPVPPTATPAPPAPTPAPPAAAPASDLETLAMAYRDAFNRRDLDGVLALFVDEGLQFFYSEFTARDKETFTRDVYEYCDGLGVMLEVTDCAPKGEALSCAALERNAYCLKAQCGLDGWHSELTLKARDGKIQLIAFMSNAATAEDAKKCEEIYPKYEAWAEANRPDEWKKIRAPVAYDLSGRPLGELTTQVCQAYLDSQ